MIAVTARTLPKARMLTMLTTAKPKTKAGAEGAAARAEEAMRQADTPPVCRPEWIVGTCPDCGGPVLENDYWDRATGHRRYRECWLSLGTRPTCGYRVRAGANSCPAGRA